MGIVDKNRPVMTRRSRRILGCSIAALLAAVVTLPTILLV